MLRRHYRRCAPAERGAAQTGGGCGMCRLRAGSKYAARRVEYAARRAEYAACRVEYAARRVEMYIYITKEIHIILMYILFQALKL